MALQPLFIRGWKQLSAYLLRFAHYELLNCELRILNHHS